MSEATKVELGFWEGITILSLSNLFLGMCLMLHFWLQAVILVVVAIPFTIWGLRSNRKSYMLQARIAEIEKHMAADV